MTIDRTTYIGGGDVASLLGIGHGSPWQLWARKTGLMPEPEDTLRWRIGRKAETMLAELFTEETGLAIAGEQMEVVHPDHDFVRGHVDGLVCDGNVDDVWSVDLALGVIDHKTDGGPPWVEVPAHYQAQAQHYLWITGLQRCWFAVMHGRWQFKVYEVKRDETDIATIAQRVIDFWQTNVLGGVPPQVTAADNDALAAVWPTHTPDGSVALDHIAHILATWREFEALAKTYTQGAAACEARIKAALEDNEEGTVGGQRVVSWRTQNRKAYEVPAGTSRVLRHHQPKE